MCKDCGCAIPQGDGEYSSADRHEILPGPLTQTVSVMQDLLSQNNHIAAHNREHFDSHEVLAINLMSSPGAGKTALLERTIETLRDRARIAVIEGDLATENDARRIRAKGVRAVQISTGSACHLDARMIHEVLHDLRLEGLDLLFIENVGNLVCPASFDLGQHLDVALLSVPEGDDKPQKYPVLFRQVDLLMLSKTDLLTVLPEFDPSRAEASLRAIGSDAPVLRVSAKSGLGCEAWCEWLYQERARLGRRRGQGRMGNFADERATAAALLSG